MNTKLDKYLDTVDRHLRPLPASERVDIVKEIKGSMIEMENEGMSDEQILERLGDGKELAKAYLGDLPGFGSRQTDRFCFSSWTALCGQHRDFYSRQDAEPVLRVRRLFAHRDPVIPGRARLLEAAALLPECQQDKRTFCHMNGSVK